jgi:hypothetical protein
MRINFCSLMEHHILALPLKKIQEREILGRTNRLLCFDATRTAYKTTPPTIHCCGNIYTKLLPNNDRGIHTQTHRHASNNSFVVARILTGPLPSNDRRDTVYRAFAKDRSEGCIYRHTDWWEGVMKYAVEMGSGTMIYIALKGKVVPVLK